MDRSGERFQSGLSRRNFLAGLGAGSAGLVAGCSDSPPATTTVPPPVTPTGPSASDAALLNFALNLEYLEAEFYLRAATGQGLTSADIGTSPGAVTGGAQVTFVTPAIKQYALEFANDELLHVRYLRKTLGTAAVDRPAIDLTGGFNAIASAAGIGATFNPFADENSFLTGAFVFEDVGVTAYHGAAKLFVGKAYLTAAAGIMATEAYHAGLIRTLIPAVGAPYLTYANQISTLRGKLGAGNETPVNGGAIVAEDNNCTVWERTSDQTLHILYAAGAGVIGKGGFFPNGVNGTMATTAS